MIEPKPWWWGVAVLIIGATLIILISLLFLAGLQTDTDILDRYADMRAMCMERGDITAVECQQIALVWMVK